jgi:hypothetical protein
VIVAAVAATLLAAGCAGASPGSATVAAAASPAARPTSLATHRALSVRLILPSRVYVAGTTVTARIVIGNSGPPVPFVDCDDPYQVVLGSARARPGAGWPACAHRDTIPSGESVRQARVVATYTACGTGPGLVRCLPGGGLPALPAGSYQARVIPVNPVLLPAPAPVAVLVVAPAR